MSVNARSTWNKSVGKTPAWRWRYLSTEARRWVDRQIEANERAITEIRELGNINPPGLPSGPGYVTIPIPDDGSLVIDYAEDHHGRV